ncbi:ketopantoate reductase family protein [Paenibacillus humicola]|uniref:ketopantoate reductase family protein n=1 Tax=Paenibacillus humicola TaxID=3110540 RepID=UPI00237A2914|nr:2-dehydropantoate 2-reductase [Paenibacillus humicola]
MFIVGAGALGLLYAARLARDGVPVTLLTRTRQQAEAILEQGVSLTDENGRTDLRIVAQPIDALRDGGRAVPASERDWIWLAVKQPHINEPLLEALGRLAAKGSPVIALQNGIGHLDVLREALPDSLLHAAVSTEGALKTGDCAVRHTGHGSLTFGLWPGGRTEDGEAQKMLLQKLEAAGIAAFLSNEMGNQIYRKLLVNAVINPLTALFGVTNGRLPEEPVRLSLMKSLHAETERILESAGMERDASSWDRLFAVCRQTAENESSMLRDVRAGRGTEIDWINGGVSRLARKYRLPSPLNDAMTAIVKALMT